MCRAGNIQEAYDLAKSDMEKMPMSILAQKAVGWALYYMIKSDAESGNYELLLNHIDELNSLDLLTIQDDSMIYDNVLFQVGNFLKKFVPPADFGTPAKLSTIFQKLRDYTFNPGKGYSYLLSCYIKNENWQELLVFLDWWNLNNLTQNDYTPFVTKDGQKLMTLAERAFIANSKALLKHNDAGRIEEFLPMMDTLMAQHEEMVYIGYFYGKLLLALGSDPDEALRVLIPFARRKASEFWVWQLLSDVFTNDEEKQLACLLRAVHCRTQESFLGKVRIKLATLYVKRRQFNYARYHIDAVTHCYASQGRRLPNEIDNWMHQPWLNTTNPDGNDPIDYTTITNDILCHGAEECIAVVTYIDQNTRRSSIIYGYEKRIVLRLHFRVHVGDILKLHYVKDRENRMTVLCSAKVQLPTDLNYAKYVEGVIDKRNEKEFAFLKTGSARCFVSPAIVKSHDLKNGDKVKSLIVYDYDRKKNSWGWASVNINK